MPKINKRELRTTDEVNVMIKQITEAENAKYENTGHSKISENQVINNAIYYYHASKFGKGIFMEETERFQEIMTTNMNMVLRSYADQFAAALNHLSTESEYQKTILNLLMAKENLIKNEESAKKILSTKWKYEELLKAQIVKKRTKNTEGNEI